MKKLLLPIILVLLGIGGGAFVGTTMAPKEEKADAEKPMADSGKKTQADKVLKAAALDKVSPPDDVEYFDLPKQFVIPLVNSKGQRSLMVMQLQIEMQKDKVEYAAIHAPKLRDVFLRTLLELSDTGAFEESVTSRATLEDVRYELKRAAQSVLGNIVHGVLIEQLMRQDV